MSVSRLAAGFEYKVSVVTQMPLHKLFQQFEIVFVESILEEVKHENRLLARDRAHLELLDHVEHCDDQLASEDSADVLA